MTAPWRRFKALNSADRRLILEAAALLSVVSIGLRICRFRQLRDMLTWFGPPVGHPNTRPRLPAPNSADRVAWAISAVTRTRQRSMTCLVRALATETMLRRRGIASDLRLGVRNDGDPADPLKAHAWIECDGLVVMGALDDLSEYHVLSAPVRF